MLLDFEQLFRSDCNITDGTYKGVGGIGLSLLCQDNYMSIIGGKSIEHNASIISTN